MNFEVITFWEINMNAAKLARAYEHATQDKVVLFKIANKMKINA